MSDLAQVGDFCPNPECPDCGFAEGGDIIRFGYTRQGRQRFRCKSCGKTFNENYGTLFYGKQTDEEAILETLALLAEGSRITSLARVKGFKEDTILAWLRVKLPNMPKPWRRCSGLARSSARPNATGSGATSDTREQKNSC